MRLKDKKVLVTGACGFIGSHLVEYLLHEGCKVKAFVFYNSFNSWGWLDTLSKDKLAHVEVFSGDVRDYSGVRSALKGADVVFHLAALIGIPFSYYSPDSYIDTNIKGTLNVLQACRDFAIEKLIITSTSEVYGSAKRVPIYEDHSLCAQSPYAASKIGADKITEAFYLSFGLPIVIARPFNTYGPRQSARAIIPTIISQILSPKKEIKLGNIYPSRDFNYVSDICDAFVEIAKSDKTIGEAINICSGNGISIENLFKMISRTMNSDKGISVEVQRERPKCSEVERLLGSNKKIMRLTSWRPRYDLERGLEKTIKWFQDKKNLRLYKSEIYNV